MRQCWVSNGFALSSQLTVSEVITTTNDAQDAWLFFRPVLFWGHFGKLAAVRNLELACCR